jgi:hypothetical protein
MKIDEVKLLVSSIFNTIIKAENTSEISQLLNTNIDLQKNKIDIKKYPKIEFHLNQNDISNLKSKNYISNDYKLTISAKELEMQSELTKLLYSIIWKNGDLGKEKHILEGVIGKEKEDEKGLIFYQFGAYIGDPNRKEPIIDQHTLRAYGLYLCLINDIKKIFNGKIGKKEVNSIDDYIYYYLKLSNTTKKEILLINDYKNWIQKHKLYKEKDFVYILDLVLFALGKSIKSKK